MFESVELAAAFGANHENAALYLRPERQGFEFADAFGEKPTISSYKVGPQLLFRPGVFDVSPVMPGPGYPYAIDLHHLDTTKSKT